MLFCNEGVSHLRPNSGRLLHRVVRLGFLQNGGCRGRRLSRGRRSPDTSRVLVLGRSTQKRVAPGNFLDSICWGFPICLHYPAPRCCRNVLPGNASPTGLPLVGSKWIPHTLKTPPRPETK